ncbi:MAG: response regulator transcription factor [Gammaproteobacteria bacterium]|nr:response regulator transcription factor [Gammaproteobacteria bacterium]MDH5653557.1 response regulator transcription factor [Gammaproteobacteria bacterium]
MNILTVSNFPLFRDGLKYILKNLNDNVNVIEVSECKDALSYNLSVNPVELVLLDTDSYDSDGKIDLCEMLKKFSSVPVVVLAKSEINRDVKNALELGVVGYIPKNTSGSVLLSALRLVMSGGVYMPPNTISGNKTNLTPRQFEVLELLVEGCSNKLIASRLKLAEATVKMHVTSIFKCMGVSNRTQAAMEAKKKGLFLSYG